MKGLVILLTLIIAGLGTWAAMEFTSRTRLEREVAALRTERDTLAKSARKKTALLDGMNMQTEGPTGLTDKAKELGINLEEEEEDRKTAANKKPSLKAPGKSDEAPGPAESAAPLPGSAARESLRAEALERLEFDYAEIFTQLALDDSRRREVLAVLRRRAGSRLDLSAKAASPGTPDRSAITTEYAQQMEEATAKLKNLLGSDYDRFVRFEKTRPERELVRDFKAALKEREQSLAPATGAKLLESLSAARDATRFDRDLMDPGAVLQADIPQDAVDRYVQQHAAMQETMKQSGAPLLTPEQAEEFTKVLEARHQETMQTLQALRQFHSGRSADGRN